MTTEKDFHTEDAFVQVASQLVVYQLKTAWLQIQKMGDKLASKYDASLSMAFVLMAIYEEEGTPVTKIAPRIGMEPNSLSRVLRTLIEKQWICKETNSKDKRVVLIRITEQGKAKREIALRSVFKIEKALLKDIHPDELAVFFKVMNTINLRLAEDME
ncbi:MAG: MarR family transcriptional regulator [Chitinophagales bacterium]